MPNKRKLVWNKTWNVAENTQVPKPGGGKHNQSCQNGKEDLWIEMQSTNIYIYIWK